MMVGAHDHVKEAGVRSGVGLFRKDALQAPYLDKK
jgi:hypothetical protein